MLLELRISNLAIIEKAELQCGPGLNVLTGETGAGKSILIHALGLLIGERAASEQVGQGQNKALVEGSFDLTNAPTARGFLQSQDIPYDDNQLVIVREVAADGRNRVRLNGRLATVATLRELGDSLIDLHGQHDHQLLLQPQYHLGFLDEFGDASHVALRAAVKEKYEQWQRSRRQLNELTSNEQARVQRLDMLQFQAEEIDAANIVANEDAALQDERSRLLNAEKLREAAALCRDTLAGDSEPGALGLLGETLRAAREIEAVDNSVESWVGRLQSAIYELDDVATEARNYAETLEADPLRLEDIEARLYLLNRLKRKYGDSLERVIAYRLEIGAELAQLSMSEEELGTLRTGVEQEKTAFLKVAKQLSAARRKLAVEFTAQVVQHLQDLSMERAVFEINFADEDISSADGIDRVEFLLSANPGQPPRPLARIASGGEISRVMLALHSVINTPPPPEPEIVVSNRVAILIFDEIDVGIGGVTAEAVGEKMRELARHFQVFCVTHLPQIARRADRHYQVEKQSDEAQTRVQITLLDGEARVHELARMMGRESEANLRHARELLDDKPQPAPIGKSTGSAKPTGGDASKQPATGPKNRSRRTVSTRSK